MATYYVDNVLGSDANNGTTAGAPKATFEAIHALGLVAGTDDVEFVSNGSTAYRTPGDAHELILAVGTFTVPYNASGHYVFSEDALGGGGGGSGRLIQMSKR